MLREGMDRVKGPFESVARDDIVTSKRGSHGTKIECVVRQGTVD
jgi:hypothetical protein